MVARGPCGTARKGAIKCWTLFLLCSDLASSRCLSRTPTPASGSEEAGMMFDYSLAALVTAGLLVYLTYALLRPESF
jgi:K+-transporting ATPase KdpF subunit